jgi:hypothetical protein
VLIFKILAYFAGITAGKKIKFDEPSAYSQAGLAFGTLHKLDGTYIAHELYIGNREFCSFTQNTVKSPEKRENKK